MESFDQVWQCVVWDDDVNTMEYVTAVFMRHFKLPEIQALKKMMEVHMEGRSILATGSREEMEFHVVAMGEYGLTASLEKSNS